MLVFLTSPPSLFESENTWDWAIDILRSRLHADVELVTALDMYADDTDMWSEVWEVMLPRLSHLVFFADKDGWIDATVYVEITESLAASKKVYLLSKQGRLIPYQKIALRIHGNALFFAKVVESS
jgi:hypothetical protein